MAKKAASDAEYQAKWLERIYSKAVRSESGCLLWQGWRDTGGYAETNYREKTVPVHRRLYASNEVDGVIADGDAIETIDLFDRWLAEARKRLGLK